MVAELVAEKIAILTAAGSRFMLTSNGDIFLRKSLIFSLASSCAECTSNEK